MVEKKPEPAAAAPIPKAASIADIPRSTSSISSQSLDGLSYVISGKHAKGNTFNTLTMFTVQFKQNGNLTLWKPRHSSLIVLFQELI